MKSAENYPDLTNRKRDLSECQVVEITSPESPTVETLKKIDHLGTILHESTDETGFHVVIQSYLCSLEDSITERFEEYNCLH